MPLFVLQNVSFKDIIDYQDIEITAGGTTFIFGDSGSGKSTLLKLLNGVQSVSAGKIFYQDKDIESYDPIELRGEVLLASQFVYLFDKSIRENFHEYYGYRNRENISDDKMIEYLELCSASFSLDINCSTMSGGERQRVYIAICLSFLPKVLMLDEPTSALDDYNANTLMANIKAFCQQSDISLLVVSHSKSLADAFADRIINLEGGARQ